MTEQPTKSSSEVKRISNPVIKPETEVEKGQSVSQPFEQPICEHCQQVNCQCRAVLLKENRPERPKCKTCKGTGQIFRKFTPSSMGEDEVRPCPDCIEQPNTELLIVKTIQGLTTCINNDLEKLAVLTADMPMNECKLLIIQALANIDSFEKTTLFELQKAFE